MEAQCKECGRWFPAANTMAIPATCSKCANPVSDTLNIPSAEGFCRWLNDVADNGSESVEQHCGTTRHTARVVRDYVNGLREALRRIAEQDEPQDPTGTWARDVALAALDGKEE